MITKECLESSLALGQMGALVPFEVPRVIGGVAAQVTGQRLGPRVPLQMGALVPFEAPQAIGGVAALVTGQRLGPRLPL